MPADSDPLRPRLRLRLLAAAALLLTAHCVQADGDREDKRFFPYIFTRRPTTLQDEPEFCDCTCGEKNYGSRIVGGEETDPNEFPWIVRLSYFNRFYCGGMLINDRYVLTAAHCVKGFMWFMIKVTLGEHDRCEAPRRPETRFVLRAITGDFSYLNFDNDVAILRLNDRVPITDTIRPICLPKDHDDLYAGKKAIVSGWGTLKEDGKPACTLQEVEVPVMSNDECKTTNYNEKMISDNMMCAGYADGGKDSCQGDSGGPLIREMDDKRYELIGVVSWGNGCARPGFPGIYTRVTRYMDWIRSNTAGGCWCKDSSPYKPTTPATAQAHEETTEKLGATTERHENTTEKHEAAPEKHEEITEQHEVTTEKHKETTEKHEATTERHEEAPEKHEEITENHEAMTESRVEATVQLGESVTEQGGVNKTSTTQQADRASSMEPVSESSIIQNLYRETASPMKIHDETIGKAPSTEGNQLTIEQRRTFRKREVLRRRRRKSTTQRPRPEKNFTAERPGSNY